MPTAFTPPTEAEVYAHLDAIPRRLQRCAAGIHDWDDHACDMRNARDNPVRSLAKATTVTATHVCLDCGLKRMCTLGRRSPRDDWHFEGGFTYDRTEQDERVRSPRGIYHTGISARSVMRTKMIVSHLDAMVEPIDLSAHRHARRGSHTGRRAAS